MFDYVYLPQAPRLKLKLQVLPDFFHKVLLTLVVLLFLSRLYELFYVIALTQQLGIQNISKVKVLILCVVKLSISDFLNLFPMSRLDIGFFEQSNDGEHFFILVNDSSELFERFPVFQVSGELLTVIGVLQVLFFPVTQIVHSYIRPGFFFPTGRGFDHQVVKLVQFVQVLDLVLGLSQHRVLLVLKSE